MPEETHAQRQFATQLVKQLREAGYLALWAGGCVRDLLLGKIPKDFDVATSATPAEVRAVFGHKRTLAVGESFGVIIVLGPRGVPPVEVATFRTDCQYVDGRRPEGVIFSSPEEDAQRRDFTINGMFYDPLTETVTDFVGGKDDLHHKVIRAIGNPRERFEEDKLRLLRAIRFAATLNFHLDHDTAAAIGELAPRIRQVSAERITQEFKRMLVDRHRRRAIELAWRLNLLSVIFPELNACLPVDHQIKEGSEWESLLRMLELLENPSFELSAAVLFSSLPQQVEEICVRMRLSNEETARITWLVAHAHSLEGARNFSLAQLKRFLVLPGIPELLELREVRNRVAEEDQEDVQFCREFLRETPRDVLAPPPLITGQDLIQLGLKPGPRFKEILELIRDAQLNLEISTREEALSRVRELQDHSGNDRRKNN